MNSREAMQEAFEARVKEQCAKNGANEVYINAVLCKDSLGNYINIGTWQHFDDFCDVWQAALASQAQQPCTTCGGSGYSPPSTDSFLCQACNGKGFLPVPEGGNNHG